MAFTDDLTSEIKKVLGEKWETKETTTVPSPEDLALSNKGVLLTGTVLYADLAESTLLVKSYQKAFAAEIYKTYLNSCCRVLRHYQGEITAFDGDRVMAVFVGDRKNTNAVRSALAINHVVINILNPAIKSQYPNLSPVYEVRQAVGIDTGQMLVARTGIRGANDLVWVGEPANLAAKLCALREGRYATWITNAVFNSMTDEVKLNESKSMWEPRTWKAQGDAQVHCSSWTWAAS